MESEKLYDFSNLRNEISNSVKDHNNYGSLNGIVYSSTMMIIAILFTSLATLLPKSQLVLLAFKLMSGGAAVLISLDRISNWRARSIYYREMRHEYLIYLLRFHFTKHADKFFSKR